MDNVFADRIEALRTMMRSHGWDAVVLTGGDPHGSEYPAERWKQVEWLTGFTGEAGDVVVTLDHAGLWTDTRYFIQAVRQLEGTGVELHKMRVPEQVPIPEWIAGKFGGAAEVYIAVDGLCIGAAAVSEIKGGLNALGTACHVVSVPNLLDALWQDRPQIPQTPIFEVDPGEDRISKLGRLRDHLAEKGCDYILLGALDEVAWTLNVRASDIEYNPLVISWLLVGAETADWFVLKEPVEDPQTEATFAALREDGVNLRYYEEIEIALSELDGSLLADSGVLNYHLCSLAGPGRLVDSPSPVALWKAVKNPVEIEGARKAHLLDGVAMEKFLWWLEKSLENDRTVSEWDASAQLGRYREEAADYLGDSFETISAYGPGAALPHYITPRSDAPVLEPHGLYLCDSGGQYNNLGTTDITRTVPLGPCSELEAEDYTLVLKGHIALARAVFPEGTPGCRIDALAREPLWEYKRNFGHGTGHGVGSFLGVHEGPQDIRQNLNAQPLMAGMIVSDEPGIYREGMHGVRHENLLLCVPAGENEFGRWLRFEPLTLCHYDTSILRTELLTPDEIAWLNSYNESVYQQLKDLLPPEVAEWLRGKTLAAN
ncbi:MAG: aminopeptidase P family protein [Bacteroidales bacterium]|nr:aminopeptidase P family protein [Bacteroidales bacterium]